MKEGVPGFPTEEIDTPRATTKFLSSRKERAA